MADITQVATLGVTIDGTQAAAGAAQVKTALAELATQGTTTANVFLDTAARAQDFARAGANAAQVAQMTGVSMGEARQAVQAFRGSVAQTTDDMFLLKAALAQLAFAGVPVKETLDGVGAAATRAAGNGDGGLSSFGVMRLQYALIAMTAAGTGTNPMMDRTIGLMAIMGSGSTAAANAMLPYLVVLAAVAEAYHVLSQRTDEAQKAAEKFRQSAAGQAGAYAGASAVNAITAPQGVTVSDLGGQTAQIAQLQLALQGLQNTGGGVLGWWDRFTQAVKSFGGIAGETDTVKRDILTLSNQFKEGTLTADQLLQKTKDLAKAHPVEADDLAKLAQLATLYKAAQEQVSQYIATYNLKKATEASDVQRFGTAAPLAGTEQDIANLKALLAAVQSGGPAAADALKRVQQAAAEATKEWVTWVTALTNGLSPTEREIASNLTLQQALRSGDDAIRHGAETVQAAATAHVQLAAAYDKARKAAEDQAKADEKNAKDLDTFMAKRVADYEKAQQKQAEFTASVQKGIATEQAETDAINRQIAVVGQSQQVRDALTVTLAGEAAVRKLLADAQAKNQTATEAEVTAVRQAAEAHERATLTLHEEEQGQRDLAAAQKHAAAEAAAQAKQQAEDLARSINATMTSLFGQITASGKNEWAKMLDSFAKSFEQLAARLAAQNLGRAILGSLGSGSFTSAIPAGALGPGDAGEVIGGGLSAAALAGTATAFVGIMGMIGSSILQTSQENAAAVAQFKTATVAWQEAFQKFIASFTATTFESQGMSLSDKFQSQIQSAIANAAAAIAGSPAAKFGASGVGLFGKTSVSLPAGLSTDPANLAATIAAVQALQGHGKNVAQDNELRILLQQLEQLDAAYKKQAAALAAQQAAEQAAFNQTLATRTLTAQADAAAAAGNQTLAQSLKDQAAVATLAAQQQAELTAAQKQGYDAATIAALEKVQALEMAALKAQQEAAAAAKAFADQQTGQTLQARLLAATGDTAAANALSLQIAQAKEYQDAVNAGWSAANLAALKFTQQAEAAKAAADAAAAAQQASLNQLTQQFKVFGTTAQDQLNAISSLYGFSGMTLAQVQALYTQYQPGQTLTPAQLQQNANIAQWVQAYQAAMGAGGLAGTAAQAGATSATTAVSAVVTDRTALMMVDLDRARNTLLDKIEQNTRKGGAGGVVFYNTFQFGQNFTQQAANAIVDELERELDKALGMKLNLQHIYTGSVAR